jgi:ribose 5-phosphate isomerase A
MDEIDISLIVERFFDLIKDGDVIAVDTYKYDKEIIDEIVKLIILKRKNVFFVATTNNQAIYYNQLGQRTISLSEKEIDIAIEFVDQIDQYNNFIKKETTSFIKDKMISQSALNLIVVVNKKNIVDNLDKDIYLEISSFAWQRTLINLQSYGVARIVLYKDGSYFKTEIGHYIIRLTLDRNISLEDFEYSVRNIPGVLETGLFLGVADTLFIYNEDNSFELEVRKRN